MLPAVVVVSLAVCWVAWCWVLRAREDVENRMHVAQAARDATEARRDAEAADKRAIEVADTVAELTRKLDEHTHRLNGVVARMGMR